MEKLIQELKANGQDGAIMFKLNDERRVSEISPLVQSNNLDDMCSQLMDIRDALQSLINAIVDKTLPKN